MTNFIYILGPAGCGKSMLASALADTISAREMRCPILNLDPGADWLPYTPELDIRTYVSLEGVMKEYKLGPNGALVVSVDLMVDHLSRMKDLITAMAPDYVIIDTPGQMELFAFRETGVRIVRGLSPERASILFLIDSFFACRASDFASMLMLATSVFARFMLPQLNVLTKIDIVEPEVLARVEGWTTSYDSLVDAVELESHELRRETSKEFLEATRSLGFVGEAYQVSALKHEGVVELYGAIERALRTEAELDLGAEEDRY